MTKRHPVLHHADNVTDQQIQKAPSSKQATMKKYIHNKEPYPRTHKISKDMDRLIARHIVKNLEPISFVDSDILHETYRYLGPQYRLPSR